VVVGSRARNTHFRDSDIDVVVVSPDFAGQSRMDRIGTLLQSWHDTPALEPIGYAPDELEADDLFLWEALSDGRPLQDDGTWTSAQDRHNQKIRQGSLCRKPGGWAEQLPP
jgi:hypothetical protein